MRIKYLGSRNTTSSSLVVRSTGHPRRSCEFVLPWQTSQNTRSLLSLLSLLKLHLATTNYEVRDIYHDRSLASKSKSTYGSDPIELHVSTKEIITTTVPLATTTPQSPFDLFVRLTSLLVAHVKFKLSLFFILFYFFKKKKEKRKKEKNEKRKKKRKQKKKRVRS